MCSVTVRVKCGDEIYEHRFQRGRNTRGLSSSRLGEN